MLPLSITGAGPHLSLALGPKNGVHFTWRCDSNSLVYADLIAEVTAALRASFAETPCRVTSSDLRVGHDPSGFRAYPDVAVRCGEPQTSLLPPKDTLLNPTLVVEVTSDRTESYDRGKKLAAYQQIDGLEAIVIVSHRERRLDIHERSAKGWTTRQWRDGEVAVLRDGQVQLDVTAIYIASGVDLAGLGPR